MAVEQTKELKWYVWVIIILIAIIAILLFVGSFGNVDVTSSHEKPTIPRPTKEEIQKKHEKLLEALIQKREKIYNTRKRIYKIVFFSIRLIAIAIWIGVNMLLYFKIGIQDIGTIIDYNNGFIIILIAIVFLFWGVLGSLQEWIKIFEKRLELWIFKKYIKLPELIENNKSDLAEIKMIQAKH
jgi:hypothetical protein